MTKTKKNTSTKTPAKTSKTAATRALREAKAAKAKSPKQPATKAQDATEAGPAKLPTQRAIYNAAMRANVDRAALCAELGIETKDAKGKGRLARHLARDIAKAVVATGKLPAALASAVKPKRAKGAAKTERGPSVTSHVLAALAAGGTVSEIVDVVVKVAPRAAINAKLGQKKQLAKHVADVVFRLRRGTLLINGKKRNVVKKDGKLHLAA